MVIVVCTDRYLGIKHPCSKLCRSHQSLELHDSMILIEDVEAGQGYEKYESDNDSGGDVKVTLMMEDH